MKKLTIMYDIVDTNRRNRLVKILEEFGERVQYSVFEFILTKAQHVHLMQRLKKGGFMEDHETDKVRVYYFDKEDHSKIRNYGKDITKDKEELFYV